MRRMTWGLAAVAVMAMAACDSDDFIVVDGGGSTPAAPRNLDAWYFDRAVYVTWELGPGWDDDAFRVYSKRTTDSDYFLIAEVTNCTAGQCSYTDVNIRPGFSYEYYVAAVDPTSGLEKESDYAVEVEVPQPTPPPVPGGLRVVALDGANYLQWDQAARAASDFAHYRVYLAGADGTDYVLGETDSDGFLDELAENGLSYSYFVSSVDALGHESAGGAAVTGTPRPDFHNEWIWDYFGVPGRSGFRFQDTESTDPVVDGDDAGRDFRLEVDANGWWLVPGPNTSIHPQGWETTALKCGVAADASCTSLEAAPTSGYTTGDVGLIPQTTYVMRIAGSEGQVHYAAIRVDLLGYDQNGDGIMIFDWAWQLQPGNPNLAPRVERSSRVSLSMR